jgi:non-canonical poly(A) RNA polymerase PAPD5/7
MSAFPDIACRAKAVTIDDELGIVVDGVHGQPAAAAAAATEAATTAADALEDTAEPGAGAAAPAGGRSIRQSLQAIRERAAPRAPGAGFGGEFISFDDPAPSARGGDPAAAAQEDAAGAKRKRGGGGGGGGGHEDSAAALEVDKRSPWARGRRYQSSHQDRTVDLHNEVLDFVEFIKPTRSEVKRRETLVDLCRSVVAELWPAATLEVFGSYATGMYLPSSDIDMVVMGCPDKNPFSLRKLAAVIKADENFDKIQVIEKARVPIIKWEDVPSGIPLNICFDKEDGVINTKWVKQQMASMQPLQPLLLVLKQFLYNRDLHETYTGGVGSYLLTMTIISFLQHHPGRGPDFKLSETNLGALLMDYLHLYGLRFNMERMGISSRGGGMYFEKDSIGWDE